MEKAGDIVHADLTLSAFCTVEILSQVVQFLGGEMVSTRYDEVVLEIEGLILVMDELTQNLAKGGCQPPRWPI